MVVRRLCMVVLLIWVCLGTSCSSKIPTPITRFSSKVTMEYEDIVFKGELSCDPTSQTRVCLTEPSDVKGMTLCWDGEVLRFERNGEEGKLDAVPRSMPLVLIHAVFSEIEARGICRGTVNGWQYDCVFEEQNGSPVALTLKEIPLMIRFEEVTKLSGDTMHQTI